MDPVSERNCFEAFLRSISCLLDVSLNYGTVQISSVGTIQRRVTKFNSIPQTNNQIAGFEVKLNWLFVLPDTTKTETEGHKICSKKEFSAMIKQRDLIEYTKTGGHYYGTSYESVRDLIINGKICLLDVHPQVRFFWLRLFIEWPKKLRPGANLKFHFKGNRKFIHMIIIWIWCPVCVE